MSRRALLWVAFVVVHVGVAVLGWVLPNYPMGDVYLVYEGWAKSAVAGQEIVGITAPFVYPQAALLPMVLALGLEWIAGYIVAWAILVTIVNAGAFALLVGTARSTGRVVAAWFWLSAIALLGPVGMYRIDAITVPLAVAGLLWLVRRPGVGAALLALGVWMKIWPAALLAAAVLVVRRRLVLIGAAAGVSAAILAVVIVVGGWTYAFSFVGEQTGRGLQLEAPVSTVYLWQAVLGVPGAQIYYDSHVLTYQVTGAGVDTAIAMMTPLLVLAVLAVAGVGAYKSWRGASFLRLMPPLALAFVLVLIVFNKVGSPQFITWLFAPLVLWLVIDRGRALPPAVAVLAIAGLTQAIYPIAYNDLLLGWPYAAALLTLRNLLNIALLVFAVFAVFRVPARHPVRTLPQPA